MQWIYDEPCSDLHTAIHAFALLPVRDLLEACRDSVINGLAASIVRSTRGPDVKGHPTILSVQDVYRIVTTRERLQ